MITRNGVFGARKKRSMFGVDKLTVRIDMNYINTHLKRLYFYEGKEGLEYNPGIQGINVINKNRFYYINFHDSLFKDPNSNMLQVVKEGLLRLFHHKNPLLKAYPCDNFIFNCCHLAEIEVFYDSYNFEPYQIFPSNRWNRCFETTFYTDDYKVKYRPNGEVKETFDSFPCFYDRGFKICSRDKISRLEFRFKKNYIRSLNITDINTTFYNLYNQKLFSKIVRYTDKLLDTNMIEFNYNELLQTNSQLMHVLCKTSKFGSTANHYWNDYNFKKRGAY